MSNRDRLLSHLPVGEYRQAVQLILDKASRATKGNRLVWTDFVEPGIIRLALPILAQLPDLHVEVNGGYTEAERARLALMPDWYNHSHQEDGIGYLSIQCKKPSSSLTHRDYLGALLGLGIKREKLGDIIITIEGCMVIAVAELASYIALNLSSVGNVAVSVQEISKADLVLPQQTTSEVVTTVASLRLDAVLAAGFNLSREKAAQFVKGDKVKLNWLPVMNTASQINEGDLISCRGKGRLKIISLPGVTKKGRQKVILHKFS